MLTYIRLGFVHYTQDTRLLGELVPRGPYWEIEACLSGAMAPDLGTTPSSSELHEHTLWAFPKGHAHGWRSLAPCERVVFHLSQVPAELDRFLPDCGYYQVSLSKRDCERLRLLATNAIASHERPSELQRLQDQALANELSLMALRAIAPRQLPQNELALQKTQMALDWYRAHMSEAPDQVAVARAVNVSSSYLRRLFHLAQGVGPKQAFMRLRMQAVDDMLNDPALTLEVIAQRVGFASASTLRRAIKDHFGVSARQLRKDRKHARYRFEGKRKAPR